MDDNELIALMRARLKEKEAKAQQLFFELKTLQQEIVHFKNVIADLAGEQLEESEKFALSRRTPTEMMRSEYKLIFDTPGCKLRDVIFHAISKEGKAVQTGQLAQMIYNTNSRDEFYRARNSLSVEMRLELKRDQPLWKKLNRNTYIVADWALHKMASNL